MQGSGGGAATPAPIQPAMSCGVDLAHGRAHDGGKVEERNSVADSPGRDTASTLPEALALQVETGFVLARHRSVEAAWDVPPKRSTQDAALADALRRTPAPEAPRIVDARKDAHAGSLRRGRQANESGRYSASLIVAGAPTISTIASSSLPFTSCTGRQEVRRSGLSARGLFRHVYVRARSRGGHAVPCTLAAYRDPEAAQETEDRERGVVWANHITPRPDDRLSSHGRSSASPVVSPARAWEAEASPARQNSWRFKSSHPHRRLCRTPGRTPGSHNKLGRVTTTATPSDPVLYPG